MDTVGNDRRYARRIRLLETRAPAKPDTGVAGKSVSVVHTVEIDGVDVTSLISRRVDMETGKYNTLSGRVRISLKQGVVPVVYLRLPRSMVRTDEDRSIWIGCGVLDEPISVLTTPDGAVEYPDYTEVGIYVAHLEIGRPPAEDE